MPAVKNTPKNVAAPAPPLTPTLAGKRKRVTDAGDAERSVKQRMSPRKAKSVTDEQDQRKERDESARRPANISPELLLANKWDTEEGADPTGWWASEKLDGVRVFYNGKHMFSRLGNPFSPPQWFLDQLPRDVTLDGELFTGRGKFSETVSIVKTMNSPHWKRVHFHVFDIPSLGARPFEERVHALDAFFGPAGTHACTFVAPVAQTKVTGRAHVLEMLRTVEQSGGEGLMLRAPKSKYEGRRSNTLLKVKTFYDAEARVTGYVPGKGRNAGVAGALKCVMESGQTFCVGAGLSDKQRKRPPKVGAIVVYRFQELTKDGVPRFPTFVGEAADKLEPKDAEVPAHRNGGPAGSGDAATD